MKHVSYRMLVFACLITSFLPACKLMPKEEEKKAEAKKDTTVIAGPDWIKQSNVYEVNVRQYTPEGTYKALAQPVPRLNQMGVDLLWFMPVTPISKTDRKGSLGSYYAVGDYKAV